MSEQPATRFPFGELPEGTVTFLFSDIEGSTQLLYRLGDQFTALLAEHHRILRQAVAHGGGQVVRTEGDAFFVAFPRATAAVAAAVEAQRALAQQPWPEGAPVRVRMGLHTGEPEVALDDYVGIAVHRAARIAHGGHGGQVLLSETTTALVQDELPPGVSLLDLGRQLLKDIRRPERICQLQIEGLPAEFPPLKTLGTLPPEGARLPRPVGACPYRGLAAFREADAPFYCGREVFVDLLEQAVRRQALTAVIVGSSGSGKSSALFAGLLPRLRKEGGWQFALLRPGAQPFYALAGALLPLLEGSLSEADRLTETRKLAERIAKGEVSLAQVVGRIHEKSPETRQILVVVDQFEELYTLCPDAKVQQAFIDELLAAAEAGKGRRTPLGVMLLTLRADFMGQALAYRPFADALQEGSLLMGPMTRQELRAAIEKPAEMQGAAFEAGLVERILDDVGNKPGNLPLLEFTLTLLWERQTDGWLTHTHYEGMGSVEGALATYADQVYAELAAGEQEQARRALVQLVRPGEGTEDTRRIATREELGQENWKLIQHLADRRLVVTGRDDAGQETAEVVHEALIQRWGRFREWMNAGRAFRAWQERLRVNLRQWQDSGRDEGALLRGAPLVVAQNWLAQRAADLSPAEVGYIEEGQVLQARRHKEQERRRQRTVLGLAGGLVVVTALAVIAFIASQRASRSAGTARIEANTRATAEVVALSEANTRATAEAVAVQEREAAQRQARLAFSRELAAAAVESLAEDQERAVLLAMQALNQAHTQQAEEALHRTVQNLRLLRTLQAPGKSGFVDLSPDDRRLVTSGELGAMVWDANTGEVLYDLDVGHWINNAAFSPDGTLLILPNENATPDNPEGSFEPSTVTILDAKTGQELFAFLAHDAWVQDVTFSPDGRLFATASGDGTAKVWDLAATLAAREGQERLTVAVEDTFAWVVEFSPDGALLATYHDDGSLHVWDASTGQELWHTPCDAADAAFSPDGRRLVISGSPGMLDVLDPRSGQRLSRTLGHTHNLQCIMFSPDGTRLASTSNDGTVKVWAFSEDTLSPLFTLAGHKERTLGLDFSSDGERVVSGSRDDTVRIWDISPDGSVEPVLYPHGGIVQSVSFSPDGSRLATGSTDGSVKLWDAMRGEALQALSGSAWIWRTSFSPDGTLLATASQDATVGLWDAASGEEVSTISGLPQQDETYFIRGVLAVAFSPDGARLATAGGDGSVRLWDVAALRQGDQRVGDETLILGDSDELHFTYDVAFSPDGHWIAASTNHYKGPDGNFMYADGVVKVWDVASGREIWTIGHRRDSPFMCVAFSPDGKRLAASSVLPGEMAVWALPDDVAGTPEELFTVGVARDLAAKLDFSPDGTQLAVPHSDGLGVWDASTGEPLKTFPHPGTAFQAAYSPDGKRLAVASFDGFGRLFFLDLEELAALAQSCLTRSLTTAECQKYLHVEECPAGP